MLALLRKYAQSFVIQTIVVLIAVVFIFWGVGSNLGNKRSFVAKINKREISLKDFNAAYERTLDGYRNQFGGTIPKGFLENQNVKHMVLTQLIRRELILQGAKEIGIVISEKAVENNIAKMDAFKSAIKENGKFDTKQYKQILTNANFSINKFESDIHADMLTKRLMNIVDELTIVPQRDIDTLIDFTNEEIRFDYVAFKAEDFLTKVETNDDAIKSWFKAHADDYLTSRQIKLKYLLFNFADFTKTIDPSDSDVSARYERDEDLYITKEQRHARHIIFKTEIDSLPEVLEAQKKKAEEVLQLARAGKDFIELAKQYSEGPSKDKGGDLGFFSRGRMIKEFEDTAFSMHEGDISDIIKTQFGYHIIKLEAIQPEVVRPLEAVAEQIRSTIIREKSKGETFNIASKTYTDIMNAGNLANFAKEYDHPIIETDFFTKDNAPADLPSDPKFLENALKINKGGLSSLIELQQGYAIIFAEDSRPPQSPEFETVREKVTKDFTTEKAAELVRSTADAFLKEATATTDLKSVSSESTVNIQDSGFLKRSNPTTNPEVPYQLSTAVLNNAWNRDLPDAPVTIGNNMYVYRITERKIGESKVDEQEIAKIKDQLLNQSRSRILNAWVTMLQERAQEDSNFYINDSLLQ
ncbi:MAG: SurA N-terminal domain-containing protein [Desulfobulbaceae bacterium]|nr:SurA N-terminal domain-containing protein [Desulfobulbaceae bacterium]